VSDTVVESAPAGLLELLRDPAACSTRGGIVDALTRAGRTELEPQFTAERLERIRAMERWHFWFAGRRKRVNRLLAGYFAAPRLVLDLGCGSGLTLELLGDRHRVVATDLREEGLRAALAADPEAWVVRADAEALPFRDGCFDAVLVLDVLEHVDDRRALAEARRVLRPGGRIVVTVPALPWLWSRRDEAAGHRRRYTRRSLQELLRECGDLRIEALAYFQFLLLPAVVLTRLSSRRDPGWLELEERPPARLNRLFAAVDGLEERCSRRVPMPLGSSLVALCEKRAA
jgi:SAM-dependent methyltransferase